MVEIRNSKVNLPRRIPHVSFIRLLKCNCLLTITVLATSLICSDLATRNHKNRGSLHCNPEDQL
jgi:hypothetical protein